MSDITPYPFRRTWTGFLISEAPELMNFNTVCVPACCVHVGSMVPKHSKCTNMHQHVGAFWYIPKRAMQ